MTETICRHCGIELPLRSPKAAERQETWVCRNCGHQNLGLFDPFARSAIRYNCAYGMPGRPKKRKPLPQIRLLVVG